MRERERELERSIDLDLLRVETKRVREWERELERNIDLELLRVETRPSLLLLEVAADMLTSGNSSPLAFQLLSIS